MHVRRGRDNGGAFVGQQYAGPVAGGIAAREDVVQASRPLL